MDLSHTVDTLFSDNLVYLLSKNAKNLRFLDLVHCSIKNDTHKLYPFDSNITNSNDNKDLHNFDNLLSIILPRLNLLKLSLSSIPNISTIAKKYSNFEKLIWYPNIQMNCCSECLHKVYNTNNRYYEESDEDIGFSLFD